MKTNSITVTCARVAQVIIEKHEGKIKKDDLLSLLGEYGVHQQAPMYISKMRDWSYVYYDHVADIYCVTDECKSRATIAVVVPLLNAKEFRRHLVEKMAGYGGIVEVGEVE